MTNVADRVTRFSSELVDAALPKSTRTKPHELRRHFAAFRSTVDAGRRRDPPSRPRDGVRQHGLRCHTHSRQVRRGRRRPRRRVAVVGSH